MRRLMAHRDARLYITGQALSVLGDSALWLAMGIWVKILTGSNSAAGLVFFAFVCGLCLAPVMGLVADRLRRRPLLIAANLATGALVAALLLATSSSRVWLIYLVMFGYGISNGLIASAQTALLAVLLPADLLGEANSALQLARQGLRIITPLLGAGLLAWIGPAPVILLDAGTFVAAAGTLLAIRLREDRPRGGTARLTAEITAGIRHVAGTASLRRLAIAGVIAASVFGFFESVDFAVVSQGLQQSPAFLGVLTAAQGIGAVIGAILATPVMRRTSERTLAAGGLLAGAVACVAQTTGELALVLPGAGLLGICVVWINIGAITLIQRQTPAALLGRVDAALTTAITVPQAMSIAFGAALIAVVNYRILLAVMAVVIAASVGYLVRQPQRSPERAARRPEAGIGAGDPRRRYDAG